MSARALAGLAEATRRAEELIAQERRWQRESLETARGRAQ
jgi:hypothetical protein